MSALVCGGAGVLSAAPACAAEWLVSPGVRVAGDYTDNPRMLREGGDSSAGAVGELNASVTRRTERTEVSMRPRIRSSRYRDDESLNSDDQYLTLALKHLAERAEWSVSTDFTRDTTLTSEIASTGIVQANRRHEGITLSGGPSFTLTERVNAGAQVYWMDNHYVDADFTGLVDYEYRALSLFSGFAFSDLSNLTLTAQGGELVVPGQSSTTRDATVRLGWRYQPHSSWTVEASTGPAYVRTDNGTDNGAVFDLDLQYEGERWTANTNVARDLTPTGRGVLTRRDQVSAGFNRRITDRLSGGVLARWIRHQDLLPQPGVAFEEITYGRLDLRLDWRLAEHWSLALVAGGATQEYESRPGSAESYRASLSIVWNGQAQSL